MSRKRAIMTAVALLLALALSACGQNAQTPETSPEAVPTVEPTVEPTAEPTPEPTENVEQGAVAPLAQVDEEMLYTVFEMCYGLFGSDFGLEETIQLEISAIPDFATGLTALPENYADLYREWRPVEPQYTFEDCNETVYATDTVNERTGPDTSFDVVGTMARGESATRIGKGTGDISDWSKVQLADGTIVYMHNSLLSTAKPQNQTQPSTGNKPSTGNRPSTGGNTGGSGGGSTGGGSSGNYGYNEYIDPSANDPAIHQRPTEFNASDGDILDYNPADLVPSGGGSASFGGSNG